MVFDTQCLPPERFELRSGLGFEFVELLPLFALPPSRVKDSQILPLPGANTSTEAQRISRSRAISRSGVLIPEPYLKFRASAKLDVIR